MAGRMRHAFGVLAVALAALAGAASVSGASLPVLQPVVLPRDHGAHPTFQVEWWYTTGTVADRQGHDFFWFATVWTGGGFAIAKVNVVDLPADRVVLSRQYIAGATLKGGQTQLDVDGLSLGWRAAAALGRWSVNAPVPGGGRLTLDLTPEQPYVLNGPHGIVREGPGAASAYYSEPRLAARGVLELGGHARHVSGQGWFDHQWGNFATNSASWHWNWFACQFKDGSDLMLYQFITPTGRPTGVQSGTFVSPHRKVSHPRGYAVTPLAPSIRPPGATSTYPLRWHLKVPSAGVNITVRARARHQFIFNRFIPSFWEGAAAITSGMPGSCTVESTREPVSMF